MTDQEYDLLDELYFVISFQELCSQVNLSQDQLINALTGLCAKEWVRVYDAFGAEIELNEIQSTAFRQYKFLASKKGLFAHNATI